MGFVRLVNIGNATCWSYFVVMASFVYTSNARVFEFPMSTHLKPQLSVDRDDRMCFSVIHYLTTDDKPRAAVDDILCDSLSGKGQPLQIL